VIEIKIFSRLSIQEIRSHFSEHTMHLSKFGLIFFIGFKSKNSPFKAQIGIAPDLYYHTKD